MTEKMINDAARALTGALFALRNDDRHMLVYYVERLAKILGYKIMVKGSE